MELEYGDLFDKDDENTETIDLKTVNQSPYVPKEITSEWYTDVNLKDLAIMFRSHMHSNAAMSDELVHVFKYNLSCLFAKKRYAEAFALIDSLDLYQAEVHEPDSTLQSNRSIRNHQIQRKSSWKELMDTATRCCMHLGNHQKAYSYNSQLLSVFPQEITLNYTQASILFSMEEYEQSIDLLRKCLDISYSYLLAWKLLAQAFKRRLCTNDPINPVHILYTCYCCLAAIYIIDSQRESAEKHRHFMSVTDEPFGFARLSKDRNDMCLLFTETVQLLPFCFEMTLISLEQPSSSHISLEQLRALLQIDSIFIQKTMHYEWFCTIDDNFHHNENETIISLIP